MFPVPRFEVSLDDAHDSCEYQIPNRGDGEQFEGSEGRRIQTLQGSPGAKAVIDEVMREWFEQSLVELVISSNTLRDAQHWNKDHLDILLSEEGLTAAVLPRYHIDQSIKRTLGSKLGAVKPKAA